MKPALRSAVDQRRSLVLACLKHHRLAVRQHSVSWATARWAWSSALLHRPPRPLHPYNVAPFSAQCFSSRLLFVFCCVKRGLGVHIKVEAGESTFLPTQLFTDNQYVSCFHRYFIKKTTKKNLIQITFLFKSNFKDWVFTLLRKSPNKTRLDSDLKKKKLQWGSKDVTKCIHSPQGIILYWSFKL